jgi:hypothetical protein
MKPPLTMTCTIERGTASDTSKGRGLMFAALATDVPCYWWREAAFTNREPYGVVAVDREHLFVGSDEDIEPGDRISTVTDHLGRTVFTSGDYRAVDSVAFERTHQDCILRSAEVVGAR